MADQYPITLAEFRAWLETKRPTAIVGKRRWANSCPIANYLYARGDAPVDVSGEDIGGIAAPAWATAFVDLVDLGGLGVLGSGIQARTALRLLDRVAHASLPADELDHEHLSLELEAVNE